MDYNINNSTYNKISKYKYMKFINDYKIPQNNIRLIHVALDIPFFDSGKIILLGLGIAWGAYKENN